MAIVWKQPRIKTARKTRLPSRREITLENPDDTPGLINGKQAGSSYEWNHARALWALGWEFQYQVPMFGGRDRRGGVVLDFLITNWLANIVINPIGEYWHRNISADQLEDARIRKALGTGTKILRPGTLDSKTFDAALAYLRREIGQR
jgi:hypothetical protein